MINIVKYTKPKKNNTNSISSVGGGVISNNASITIDTALSPTSSNAVENKAIYKALMDMINQIVNTDNTLDISRSGDTVTINSNTFKFDTNGNLTYSGAVDVNSISATSGSIDTINSNNGRIQEITGNILDYENGSIYDLAGDTLNYKDGTLETLTVTKAAHFFELIIDQIKSTQGQIIITPANAKFDKVVEYTNYYRCYWKNEDGDKQIGNEFEVNDQVVCQTFNATTGSTFDASNKYYWALVVNTGSTTIGGELVPLDEDDPRYDPNADDFDNMVLEGAEYYHYIDISKTDKDSASNGVPQVGDEVAQLGNRNMTDRQAAIIISAYNNQFLDSAIQAPSIVQYAGINNYDLSTHRTNVISKGFNQFKGKFSTNSGSDIEDMIAAIGSGTTMYIHTAYADSSDGQTNFSKTYYNGAAYIGMCSNFSSTDTNLGYQDYQWMRLKGDTGDAGFSYNLLPTREYATVTENDVLVMGFTYQLVKIEGTTVTTVNPAQSNFYMRFKSDIAPYTQLNRGTTSFSFSSSSYYTNYHKTTPRPTYFTVELLENQTIVETRVVNIRFAAGASLTIADDITATVQSVSGDLNTYKQTADASISNLTNRMGTAESNIIQTQTAITHEVSERVNGDRKYFPIIKPWYDYDNNLITDYVNDPLRYKGDADIYSTPTYLKPDTYKVRIFVNSSSLGSSYAICYHGNQYPDDLGGYDPITGFTLSTTGRNILAKDGTTLYEYAGEVTIEENGYYGLNWWENYYLYVPEESNQFESNYSRITQTNDRITQQVANINGQISSIDLKADSIEMKVDETSVKLDNGNFTINANTSINGSLAINSADKGFLLNNTYGNTYIVGDSIGTFDNFKQKNYIIKAFESSVNADATTPSTQSYIFNYEFPIGNLGLNTKIEFNDISFVTHRVSDGSLKSEDSYSAYVTLYKEGEDVCQWNISNTHTPTNYYTTNATTPYTYSIKIVLHCGYSHYQELLGVLNCAVTLKLKEYTQTFNIIGYDGIASNFGANKTFYVGGEGTYVKYGDDKILKVSTDGVQKYAGSTSYIQQNKGYLTDTCTSKYMTEYAPINGTSVRVVTGLTNGTSTSTCYLQPNDDMILFKLTSSSDGKRCNVYLGPPTFTNIGRKIYLKKMTEYGDIYVYGDNYNTQTNKIRTGDGSTTNVKEIDYRSRYFIADGEYWIEFYCG